MDRQLAERMVGAACLLAVLVLVVPAILDGNPDSGATLSHPQSEEAIDLRTHTIRLQGEERAPPVPTAVRDESGPVEAVPPASAVPKAAEPALPEPVPAGPEPSKPALPEPVTAPGVTPAPAPAGKTPSATHEPVRNLANEPIAAASGAWIVQLGSFSRRENAERLAAELKHKGFTVSVLGGGGASGTLFRVRAGPATDRAAAEALATQLAAAGFKGGQASRQ